MKEYVLKIPEIRNRKISARYDELTKELEIFSDGNLLSRNKDFRFFIEDDDGSTVVFELDLDEKDNILLSANGRPVELSPALSWFEWGLCGLPLFLVFIGGFIGGAIGGAAFYGNMMAVKSSMPRPLRYLSALGLSSAALALYLVIRIAIGGIGGCFDIGALKSVSGGASQPEVGAPVKPEGTPNLYVDNGTETPLQFSIDGRDSGTVPPFSFVPVTVKPGRHKFVFSGEGKQVDSFEGEVPAGRAAVANPKGAASYVLISATYSVSNLAGFSGGFGHQDLDGQNFVTGDYGLLETIPDKIEVKVKTSEIGATFSRSKIAKKIPNNMDSRQAFSILRNYMEKSDQAFSFEDKEQALMVLLTALGGKPLSDSHRDLLLEQAAKSERYVLEAALKSLAAYENSIPDDKLLKLALTPEKVNTSGMSFDSPAANGASGWAMRILLQNGKAGLLMEKYPTLNDYQRNMLLKIAAETENLDPRPILEPALLLDPPIDSEPLASLARMILSDNLKLDDDLMARTDAFISKIANQSERNQLQDKWDRKLAALSSSGQGGEYLRNRLLASLKSGAKADDATIKSMIRQGLYDKLIETFPTMDGQVKRDLVRHLPTKELEKVPDGAIELAWLAVADPGESISAAALSYLADNSGSFMDFLRKAWTFETGIVDAAARKRFSENLWSCSYGKIGRMDTSDICAAAGESPTRNFVKLAIEILQQDSDRKAANFAELASAWPRISSESNRIWILEETKDVSYIQFAFRKPEELNAFKKLFDLGLSNKSPAVRAAALDASFKLGRYDYPDEKTAKGIISADLPPDRAAEIRKNHDFWICHTWKDLTRDRNLRMKALSKIVEVLENTADPEVAKFASSQLDHPTPEEKAYIADLARLARESRFKECRIEAMSHLSALDFSKDDNVTSAFLKALEDSDAEIRYRAFMALGHKCQKYNEAFRAKHLPKLKAAAARESDQKTKGEMENMLRNSLDAYEEKPNPPPTKNQKPKNRTK